MIAMPRTVASIILTGFSFVWPTPSAQAGGTVLSISGPPAGAYPGEPFQIRAVVSGTGTTDSVDFDIAFTGQDFIYNGYLFDPVAFQTGGGDDFSIPKGALNTGRLPLGILTGESVHFEAVTRPNMTFGIGTVVTLDLTMPYNVFPGQEWLIEAIPDISGCGIEGCSWNPDPGTAFIMRVTVPEPLTVGLLVLGGLLVFRRKV